MTETLADAYDASQSTNVAKYKVPQHVRDAGCHYGRQLKEDEIIMQQEDVVFFYAHMRASVAVLSAYNLAHETSAEHKEAFASLVKEKQLYKQTKS